MGNPNHDGPQQGRHHQQQSLAAVKRIIEDADKTTQENIRLATMLESYRRTIFLLIQHAGGEVVIEKAVANLLNGQAGVSKRFEVVGNDPTRPDVIVYREVASPEDLNAALIGGQTPQEAAESRYAAEQTAITWASWELECVLPGGQRWRTSCHGDHALAEVDCALPAGTRVVVAKLTGRTGEAPEFQEQITFTPPPPDGLPVGLPPDCR